jgi:hypothetical protein
MTTPVRILSTEEFAPGSILKLVDANGGQLMFVVVDESAGGSGITQLTGAVTAGPGSGSQVATVTNPLDLTGPGSPVRVAFINVVNDLELGTANDHANTFVDCAVAAFLGLGVNNATKVVIGNVVGHAQIASVLEWIARTPVAGTGLGRMPAGDGSVTGGTSTTGLFARNQGDSADIPMVSIDSTDEIGISANGEAVKVIVDASSEVHIGSAKAQAVFIDAPLGGATVEIGDRAAFGNYFGATVNVDSTVASGGGGSVNVADNNADSLQLGRAGMPGGVSMPDLVTGGGGVVQAASSGLGVLGSTGFRFDQVASGSNVAIVSGGNTNSAAIVPPSGGSLIVSFHVRDLGVGESEGPGATTVSYALENVGGNIVLHIVNSAAATRHVDYRVIAVS